MTEQEKKDLLWEIVQQFIQTNHIYCEEVVYQTDEVSENALEFIGDVCELVGYLDDDGC